MNPLTQTPANDQTDVSRFGTAAPAANQTNAGSSGVVLADQNSPPLLGKWWQGPAGGAVAPADMNGPTVTQLPQGAGFGQGFSGRIVGGNDLPPVPANNPLQAAVDSAPAKPAPQVGLAALFGINQDHAAKAAALTQPPAPPHTKDPNAPVTDDDGAPHGGYGALAEPHRYSEDEFVAATHGLRNIDLENMWNHTQKLSPAEAAMAQLLGLARQQAGSPEGAKRITQRAARRHRRPRPDRMLGTLQRTARAILGSFRTVSGYRTRAQPSIRLPSSKRGWF